MILLDLGLPDSSGLDLLRTIPSVPELRTTPVVVLSCSDDETTTRDCLECGANAFAPKSAGHDDFHAQVRRVGQFWVGDSVTRKSDLHRDDPPPALPAANRATLDEFPAFRRKNRILLVDDDKGHVTLIQRALRRASMDCVVDVAQNGAEAIDYLFGVGTMRIATRCLI